MRVTATIIAAFAGLAAAAFTGAAFAATKAPGTTAYEGDTVPIPVNVRATVSAGCGFLDGSVPEGTYDAGDVSGSWTVTVNFKLDCNVASRVGVHSASGGLLYSAGSPPSGYTNLAPYNIQLNLAGNTANATGTCAAATLTTAAAGTGCTDGIYGNPATATTGLKLNSPSNTNLQSSIVFTGTAASGILLASPTNGYTDTVIVTIAPSP